jgi:type IV pilus assembly protein PilC
VLLVLMTAVIGVLIVFVIPQFKDFYSGLGGTLPLPTRILLAISDFVRGNALVITLSLVAAIVAVVVWYRRESSKMLVDSLLLRVPVLGEMLRMYSTSALAVAANSIGNRAMSAAIASGGSHIREGRSLTVALEATHMVDGMAIEMVKVGEQTGALADMLNTLAEFYDQEMETRLATVMGLVEPILLMIMAVVVAGMLIAFYLPMFEIFGQIKR